MSYDSTVEDLVNNVNTFISDNIATYVTGVNSAKADGITLEAIRKVVISDEDPYRFDPRPAILNFPEEAVIENIASGWDKITMQFISIIVAGAGTPDTINTKMLRYVEALRQVLRDYIILGISTFDVDRLEMRATYYPTAPDIGVKVGTITFRVTKEIPA